VSTTETTSSDKRVASNVIYAIVALVSMATLLPFLNESLGRDEAASLYSARLSWSSLWHLSFVVDRVLLVYYVLLHFWLDLSYSIDWARALSLLAFGLTVYFVGAITRRMAGFWCGLLAAALTCTNPLMIASALDARPYALAALVSVLSVAALLKWFVEGELRSLWIFSFLAIAVLLLQLFCVLAPLSALVACAALEPRMFRRHWRQVLPPITVLAVAGVAFLALVARQQGQVSWIPGLTLKSLAEDMEGPASSVGGHLVYPAFIAAIGLLSLVGCILGWRRRSLRLSRVEVDRIVVMLSWAAVPTVILVLITAIKPVYVERYITASVPGMAIALALLITYAMRALGAPLPLAKRTIVGGAVIAGLVILIANSVAAASSPEENLKGATQYVARNASSTSEVAVPGHFLTGGVEYYLDRADSPLRLWPQMSGKKFDDRMVLLESERTFADAPNNVWLVNDGSVTGSNGFISSLENHGFFRVDKKSFFGVSVTHFRRHHDAK
jgi:mannosyltransferase